MAVVFIIVVIAGLFSARRRAIGAGVMATT
jgi:hypothetical protein